MDKLHTQGRSASDLITHTHLAGPRDTVAHTATRFLACLVAFASALMLLACGGGGGSDITPATTPVAVGGDGSPIMSIDGTDNNEAHPLWGAAGTALRLDVPQDYADGISAPAGSTRPSARAVSNALCAQVEDMPSSVASDFFWLWGQFLDHDIDLTGEGEESFDIAVPTGDIYFDPTSTGSEVIPFHRSAAVEGTGTDTANPRRHPNLITSYIDASNVYGSDATRATALRTLDGTGRLRTSAGNLLPFNVAALGNAPTAFDPTLFLAGDVRANENVGLTSIHTVFMREHNRLVTEMAEADPTLTGDDLYEAARTRVRAIVQVITVREFLPMLLGDEALGPYAGYDETVEPSIGVFFSTAAYRFGHSMVSGTLLRLDASGNEIVDGHLSLADAFFNPTLIVDEGGIEPILRGAAAQPAQALDPQVVDELRNLLFGPPGSGGLDLAALNLQRGRDHGLASYNAARVAFGLSAHTRIRDVTRDQERRGALASVYDSVDAIDPWVGALCEDRRQGALVGELLYRVFRDQFRRLRDGDRFWYQNVLDEDAQREVEQTTLASVIRRNTSIGSELPDRVMRAPDADDDRRVTTLVVAEDAEALASRRVMTPLRTPPFLR